MVRAIAIPLRRLARGGGVDLRDVGEPADRGAQHLERGAGANRRRSLLQICRHLWLPERENVCFGAGFVERDLERPLVDRFVLACELVEAAVAEHAVAVLVDVDAV